MLMRCPAYSLVVLWFDPYSVETSCRCCHACGKARSPPLRAPGGWPRGNLADHPAAPHYPERLAVARWRLNALGRLPRLSGQAAETAPPRLRDSGVPAPGPRPGKLRSGPGTGVSAAVTGTGDCSGGLGRGRPRAKEVAGCLAMPRRWWSRRIGRNFPSRTIALGVPAGTRDRGSRCSGPRWRLCARASRGGG
jgi:hypothetical protein